MAWNARFVYRNYVDDSTVTASDEVTALPDDNLQVFQPGDVWRADTLSSLSVQVLGGVNGPREWDTLWLGYTNLTPKRNLLRYSNTLNDAVWTATNALVVEITTLDIAPKTTDCWGLTADGAGSVVHQIAQTWTPTLTMKANQQFTATIIVNDAPATNPDEVELAMVTNAPSELLVRLDLSTGTLGSVSAGSGWSGGTATVETVTVAGTDSYKITLTGTQANVITSMVFRVRQRVGGSSTFVQSGETVYLAQGFMSLGDISANEAETTSENAAGFRLDELGAATTSVSDYWAAVPRDLTDWDSSVGWVHGVGYYSSTVRSATSWQLLISDENNADSYVEAGRMVVGKSFQPTGVLVGTGLAGAMSGVSRTYEAGRRVFDLEFEYLDAATAERDFLDMYQHVKKREGLEIESAGGQRYSPDNRPVLCVLDDAASDSEPERIIYGTLEGQPITHHFGTKSRTTIRIKELPK